MASFIQNKTLIAQLSASPTTGYSGKIDTRYAQRASLQCEVVQDTATFAVTTTVWATNKDNPDTSDDSDWVDITSLCTVPTITGASASYVVLVPDAACSFASVRAKFVRTGGAGTITTYQVSKAV